MHEHFMTLVLAIAAASTATLAGAQAPQAGEGFFRPAADPALTSIPAPAPPAPAPRASRSPQPTAAEQELARERRMADAAAMDRVEALHSRVMAETPPKAPVITSPLDGTAPVMSPLDGTAPIVSPVGR